MADDRLTKYGRWLVENADKKGTPEFETVANAYRKLRGSGAPDDVPTVPVGEDVLRSGASGLRLGAEQAVGTFGDVGGMQGGIAEWAAGKLGASPETQKMIGTASKFLGIPGMALAPSTKQIQNMTNQVLGEPYRPETTMGDYAHTAGTFAGGALLPGGAARRAANVLAPAILSETAGQMTEGSALEPYARLGGALAGGVAVGPLSRMAGGITGVGDKRRAAEAINEVMQRAKTSPSNVRQSLREAAAEGQPMYNVADATAPSGQRMLAGIAKSPGDARQVISERLDARQAGQGRRIANQLAEGFDAPDTAQQRREFLSDARRSKAKTNYGNARANARPVDVTPAIDEIRNYLRPGLSAVASNQPKIRGGRIQGQMMRVQSMLTDGKSQLTDFDRVFLTKREVDSIIGRATREGDGALVEAMKPIRDSLDDALAAASDDYANARDIYRQDSLTINALDEGANRVNRGRAEDNVRYVGRLNNDQAAAFRSGYADPMISKAARSPVGVNKARPLLNDATQMEFPAVASAGKGDRLLRQLNRENTMFETRAKATGGSQTAENLADIADVSSFDPNMIFQAGTSPVRTAILGALRLAGNAWMGRNKNTRELIAQALMETDPDKAFKFAQEAAKTLTGTKQDAVLRALAAARLSQAKPAEITVYGNYATNPAPQQ